MFSLADMLLGNAKPIEPAKARIVCDMPPPQPNRDRLIHPDPNMSRSVASKLRCAHLPCKRCGHPNRHISAGGRCNTTLCSSCYRMQQRKQRVAVNERKPSDMSGTELSKNCNS